MPHKDKLRDAFHNTPPGWERGELQGGVPCWAVQSGVHLCLWQVPAWTRQGDTACRPQGCRQPPWNPTSAGRRLVELSFSTRHMPLGRAGGRCGVTPAGKGGQGRTWGMRAVGLSHITPWPAVGPGPAELIPALGAASPGMERRERRAEPPAAATSWHRLHDTALP